MGKGSANGAPLFLLGRRVHIIGGVVTFALLIAVISLVLAIGAKGPSAPTRPGVGRQCFFAFGYFSTIWLTASRRFF